MTFSVKGFFSKCDHFCNFLKGFQISKRVFTDRFQKTLDPFSVFDKSIERFYTMGALMVDIPKFVLPVFLVSSEDTRATFSDVRIVS